MDKDKKIILAIDDVSLSLTVIKGILSRNFDVRVAKSGELALYILGSVKVDLILLDIEMPGMSGFDFLEIIKELPDAEEIPVIIVTSHATPGLIVRASMAGARDYVVKPVKAQALKEKVYKVLDMPFEDSL